MAEPHAPVSSQAAPVDAPAPSRALPSDLRRRLRAETWQRAKQMRLLYLLFLLPLAIFVIFHYFPIYGNIIAFKDFRIGRGYWGSRWVGLLHFEDFFRNPYAWRIIRNTVVISTLKLLWGFPAPILLALLVNELTSQPFKKTVQTVSYLPHFMSWVILATILREILSPQSGPLAQIAIWLGQEPPDVLQTSSLFRPMLIVTEIWKEMGWQSVIYLAALASIRSRALRVRDRRRHQPRAAGDPHHAAVAVAGHHHSGDPAHRPPAGGRIRPDLQPVQPAGLRRG